MKGIILISGLLFATLSNLRAQNQFSDYVNYLKDSETLIQQPDPKVIQRHEWHLFPKPLSVKKFNQKVVVVFDRKQWEAFSYMHRKMWMRRMEMRRGLDELETIRDKYKRK